MTEKTNESVENWQVRAETAEAALVRAQTETDARLVRSELKAAAVKAGMVDLDGLKLLDTSDVKLNEHGEVEDSAAILEKLKYAKPWLFNTGKSSSSSSAAHPPRPEPPRLRQANELSHEEWQAARAALLRRR